MSINIFFSFTSQSECWGHLPEQKFQCKQEESEQQKFRTKYPNRSAQQARLFPSGLFSHLFLLPCFTQFVAQNFGLVILQRFIQIAGVIVWLSSEPKYWKNPTKCRNKNWYGLNEMNECRRRSVILMFNRLPEA